MPLHSCGKLTVFLEAQLEAQLRLPRVSEAGANGAVEVEQQGPRDRDLVRVVEEVEDLDQGLDLHPLAYLEYAAGAEIERVKPVLLPRRVTPDVLAVDEWAVERVAVQVGVVGQKDRGRLRRPRLEDGREY